MQTLLPLTLSLTFCNHEILMTNIEFKVQFVSESFGGKGSCKGTVFKETGVWTWKASARDGGARGCVRPPPPASSGPTLVWRGVVTSCQEQQRVNQISKKLPHLGHPRPSTSYSTLVFPSYHGARVMIYICIYVCS